MDKGMKKVVNLVTNYMSALCETGRVPGRVDRNIKAGTAVYFPGGGAAGVIDDTEKRGNKGCEGVAGSSRRVLALYRPKDRQIPPLTSANLAELNGLKAMYRIPAVCHRIVLTRDWNVKLGPHVIGHHLDTSAYIEDLDGFFARVEAKKRRRTEKSNKKVA